MTKKQNCLKCKGFNTYISPHNLKRMWCFDCDIIFEWMDEEWVEIPDDWYG